MKKKILMVSGSPRKNGDGAKLLKELELLLPASSNIECEILFLKDYKIEMCTGCLICQKKEGETCPIKDDMHIIKAKFNNSDGYVFISPVYTRMISAQMKILFDRLSFWLHRPVHSGKPAILLCTASFAGAKQSLNYMKIPVSNMGMHVIDSIDVLSSAYKNNEVYKSKSQTRLKKVAEKMVDVLIATKKPKPSASEVFIFNKWKYKVIFHKKQYPGDYLFWENEELLDKDYFYPTRINPILKIMIPLLVKTVMKKMSKKIGYIQ